MIDICVKKALRDFTLDVDIHMGECGTLVLLGENGAGKSTVLNLVAGLMTPDTGKIRIGNETFIDTAVRTCIPAESRGIGYVFQDYALFPHLTVHDNIAYGMRARHLPSDITADRVRDLAGRLGLREVLQQPAGTISGGQSQRVALARALAVKPKILLLDEPFSALDVQTRVLMRRELREVLTFEGIPAILVTHDIRDAFEIGCCIGLMERGKMVMYGEQRTVFQKGLHPFIDQFFSGAPSL